ncbi:glycosyltransferase family 9 protein [Tomitella gaofuii]|uniref:glycosyltransferase family 9 protein n=1 Tax=Tomitella gaofuii TaxID=2760083 RepID=UPI0015FC2ADE|nr:glycosyltransferase family 9 protein [Tomitella gaofuii]
MTDHMLIVRLDSAGDMLLAGPAVRAAASGSHRVTVLAGPRGAAAAELLPGVDEVIAWEAPWIAPEPGPLDPAAVDALIRTVVALEPDGAVVLTSFHQSALPTALLLRLAGVGWIAGFSEDYPGSLLDVRMRPPGDIPESERALRLMRACGFPLQAGDDRHLRIRRGGASHVPPLPQPYVVLHPGASVPARMPMPQWSADVAASLAAGGYRVVVTGGPGERELTALVAGRGAMDLGGRTDLPELASVLADAQAVIAPNTAAAHLAAAVGTPVVSLFAPVVDRRRWAPHGVPSVVLGDQNAACRGTRARACPVPGHPCLGSITYAQVVQALSTLGALPYRRVSATSSSATVEGLAPPRDRATRANVVHGGRSTS